MPKLLLINPVDPRNIFSFLNLKGSRNNGVVFVPPIGLGYIAAVTPREWEVELIDESISPFAYQHADLVGLTATTAQAPRAYEIAQLYRQKNIPVVMGGIHASVRTDEASRYVDVIVTGEAEEVWPRVLKDFLENRLQQIYRGGPSNLRGNVVPRRDLFDKRYRIGSIVTSRGCPFSCDFCTVTVFNGPRLRRRAAEDVANEIATIPQNLILFLDDNLIGHSRQDKEQAKELFSEIIRRKIRKKWACQTSIDSLDDERVLRLAKESGCIGFFVGIESLDEETLARMAKNPNLKIGTMAYHTCIEKVHRNGMIVMGNFILGYEKSTKEIEADTCWMRSSSIDVINFALLTPYPGTRLFERLENENRISCRNYPFDWVYYDADHPVSRMDHVSLRDLYRGIRSRGHIIYSHLALLKRFVRTLVATRSLLPSCIALFVNLFWTRRKNIARLSILKQLMEKELI